MDDILASIRRIMHDEQARLQTGAPRVEPPPEDEAEPDPVLMLDSSMIIEDLPPEPTFLHADSEPMTVHEELSREPEPLPELPTPLPVVEAADLPSLLQIMTESLPQEPASDDVPSPPVEQVIWMQEELTVSGGPTTMPNVQDMISAQTIEALVAPAAAAAATASVEALLKELRQERAELLEHQAPTIEAVVRSEIRPLLKTWLDAHLPTLVERLVRAEIERLVGGRAGR